MEHNTFVFYHKNSSAILTISAPDFESARSELIEIVGNNYGWRCDNEDGEY